MKKTRHTSSPLVPIGTAIGTGAVAVIMSAMCPVLLPFAWLTAIPLWCAAKAGVAAEVDQVGARSANKFAEEWKGKRRPGERGVDVSTTLYSGGAFFDLPMTRTYRFELDKDDLD